MSSAISAGGPASADHGGDGRHGGPGGRRPPAFAWALGAVLAASGPSARLVQFLTVNRAEIARPEVVVRTAVLSGALLAVLTLAWCAWSRRSPVTTGAALGVFGFFFFTAGIFGPGALSRPAWFAIVVGLCVVAAASAAQRTWAAATAAVVAVGYIAIAGVDYAEWREGQAGGLAVTHTSDAVPAGTLPNVYYVVVDGYARDDVARTLYPGDDATAFNDTLDSLGFEIDSRATANYPQTDLSVPSTLEQALILDERTPARQVRRDRSPMLKGANKTVTAFRELGYHYVQTDGRRHDALACDRDLADGCLGPRAGARGISLGQVERSLVELTPVGPMVLDAGIVDQESTDIWPADVVDGVIDGAWLTGDRPIFVYAHIIAPHPPYVRDGGCNDIQPVGNLGEGWGPEHLPYYYGQLRCLRTELDQSLTRLVEADPTAIVVVQSDHGPGFGLDLSRPLDDWTDEMLRTRFAAFRAWRMPQRCLPTDEAASSLVNTFRVVEACVRAETPELVEPRSFLTAYGSTTVEALPPGLIAPAPG